jgi:hypothetical protein
VIPKTSRPPSASPPRPAPPRSRPAPGPSHAPPRPAWPPGPSRAPPVPPGHPVRPAPRPSRLATRSVPHPARPAPVPPGSRPARPSGPSRTLSRPATPARQATSSHIQPASSRSARRPAPGPTKDLGGFGLMGVSGALRCTKSSRKPGSSPKKLRQPHQYAIYGTDEISEAGRSERDRPTPRPPRSAAKDLGRFGFSGNSGGSPSTFSSTKPVSSKIFSGRRSGGNQPFPAAERERAPVTAPAR